jgi:hypothetical protein
MTRLCIRATVALALFGTGWVAARAQMPAPDFEIIVEAPSGSTSITCVRGCSLAWVERGVNPNSKPISSFDFSCSGARCSSAKVGGWITN